MSNPSEPAAIRLRGVRQNNLKGFDLDVPQRRLVVITGLSGSGKSSLAFDTLFAEGQRRYIETFSPYARQFFDRMDKPRVDGIEGIPPAIAIEQRNSVRTTRSTVGTMTEICDHLKLLWPHLARLHCRGCGRPVHKDTPQRIWHALTAAGPEAGPGRADPEVLVTFDLPLTEKLSVGESLALVVRQGYQRILLDAPPAGAPEGDDALREAVHPFGGVPESRVVRLDEASDRLGRTRPRTLTIVQDRLRLTRASRARFVEACEQAFHFGKGRLSVHRIGRPDPPLPFSNRFHCAHCDIDYREPTPALFSFNHPVGACPTCRGFGRTITIDYDLAIPDRTRTLAEGAVKPWQTGTGAECQRDLMKACRLRKAPTDVPFRELPRRWQDWVLNGDPDYGKDTAHEWPRAWYGVKGYFRWLESKSYKMHVRVLLSRYRSYQQCTSCDGRRFQPEALLYRLPIRDGDAGPRDLTLSDFYQLPLRDALDVIDRIAATRPVSTASDPLGFVLAEVRSRLGYLVEVGLGYLSLDRPTRSLSGGETERVNLTTCLGTRLVNTLYVLDEPSVGLHPRDTHRLIRILKELRDLGNTVVVVEHEASVIRAADEIIDLGPGHGEAGGHVVFQGTCADIRKSAVSLTGGYLSGRLRVEAPVRRPVPRAVTDWLRVINASRHNLSGLSVNIPLGRLVCLTGVSGSGKTTLLREILLPGLEARLKGAPTTLPSEAEAAPEDVAEDQGNPANADPSNQVRIEGGTALSGVILVDQSPLGRTPRSNPAVYSGAFDDIRELFARSDEAGRRGLNASAFSFNSIQGQCERCRGAGFEKIEMQFLSDVFIRCPDCDGRRYRPHILEVKLARPRKPVPARGTTSTSPAGLAGSSTGSRTDWSIADLLEATVDEAIEFLDAFGEERPARRAAGKLRLVQEVGLGYLRLGQPINTLSGGESQRLKLVGHLVGTAASPDAPHPAGHPAPLLFLFDEPTTGLHFDDVRVLMKVFQRLVDAGHSVIVIEHNLDVIRCADWVIDLGPEAGDLGGRLVVAGTPEAVAACDESHTGAALRGTARPSDGAGRSFRTRPSRPRTGKGAVR